MSFEAGSIRSKTVSGDPPPETIIHLIQAAGSIMLGHDNCRRLAKNGYLFIRYERFSVSLRTSFKPGELDGVRGVCFTAKVRKKRARSESIVAMVIDFKSSRTDADETDEDGDMRPSTLDRPN